MVYGILGFIIGMIVMSLIYIAFEFIDCHIAIDNIDMFYKEKLEEIQKELSKFDKGDKRDDG